MAANLPSISPLGSHRPASIANIITKDEAAHARTASHEAKLPVPRWEEEQELEKLSSAEDKLMFDLVDAPCASDGEFFMKAAYILKVSPDFMRAALVDALQDYLNRRPNPGGA